MRSLLLAPILLAAACGGAHDPSTDPGAPTGPTVSLETRPLAAIPAGAHVVVVFFQLEDSVPTDPPFVIGHDQPLGALAAGERRRIEIPLAAIEAPTDAQYQIDGAATIGMVAVVTDQDGSGAIEPDELTDDDVDVHGVGYLAIVGAPAAREARPDPQAIVDMIFLEGLDAGVHPYRILPGATEPGFDGLGKHQDGTVYPLEICPRGDQTCEVTWPNLT